MQARKTTIPWSEFPIFRHWSVKDLTSRSNVIMRFGNGKPAIIEGSSGAGRVIMMTTPVSDPLNVRGRPPWNQGTDSWPYLVIVNEVIKYLVEGSDSQLNYDVGQVARLAYRGRDAQQYQLFHPRGSCVSRLDELFGKEQYQYARDQSSINRKIGVSRRGHEFYSWALVLVVFALALEHLLSNRFYGASHAQSPTSLPPRAAQGAN
jgi:hypothetical protein